MENGKMWKPISLGCYSWNREWESMGQKLSSKGLQNRCSFSKGNNEVLGFFFVFKHIVLDET